MPWEQTENEIRERIKDPGLFQPDSFRSKEIAPGIRLIIGKLKGEDKTTAQSIRFDKNKFTLEQAKAWMEKHRKDFAEKELQTFDIKDRVIFSAGIWNGDKYDEKDIENIVNAFKELKGQLRPPIKLGHTNKQKFAQKDGLPAIGWVENLRKVGKNLVADFVKIPKKIYELIKAGAYRTVSPEIYWNLNIGDKKYPYALKAVSLLGADIPACKNVDDILNLYYVDDENMSETKIYTLEAKEMEELKKRIAELEVKLSESEKSEKEKTEKINELTESLKKTTEEKESLTKQLSEIQAEKKKAEYSAALDNLVKEKKILPAHKEKLMNILLNTPEELQYSEKETKVSLKEAILKIFSEMPELNINTETNSGAGRKQDFSEEAIQEYADKNKLSYGEAYVELKKKLKIDS